MATTAAQLKARFTEFASVSDDLVSEWLGVAIRQMNPDRWGGKRRCYCRLRGVHPDAV